MSDVNEDEDYTEDEYGYDDYNIDPNDNKTITGLAYDDDYELEPTTANLDATSLATSTTTKATTILSPILQPILPTQGK